MGFSPVYNEESEEYDEFKDEGEEYEECEEDDRAEENVNNNNKLPSNTKPDLYNNNKRSLPIPPSFPHQNPFQSTPHSFMQSQLLLTGSNSPAVALAKKKSADLRKQIK